MHHSTSFRLSMAAGLLLLAGCGTQQGTVLDSTQDSSTAASQQAVIQGTPTPYFGAMVATWSDLEHEEIGFSLPLAAIQAAPTTLPPGANPEIPDPAHSVRLELPAEVKSATFLDHIQVDYNPVGHPPAPVYTLPHFDIHFYGITSAEQDAIDCTDTSTIAKNRLPENYAFGPPNVPPECVPAMGFHAVDITAPELSPTNPQPFTKTMVLGYYQGRLTFVEPMVTRDELLKKQSFEMAIPHPEVVARNTLLPTKVTATFDEANQQYDFVLSDFVEVE